MDLTRKCAICDTPLEHNYYFCLDCNYTHGKKYVRVTAYSLTLKEAFTLDYLCDNEDMDDIDNAIKDFLDDENLHIISKTHLPSFDKGTLPLLSYEEFKKSDIVLRKRTVGYPFQFIVESTVVCIELDYECYFVNVPAYTKNTTEYYLEKSKEIKALMPEPSDTNKCLLCHDYVTDNKHLLCPYCYYECKKEGARLHPHLKLDLDVITSKVCVDDLYYQGHYPTTDGRYYVKSRAEKAIADYFYKNDMYYVYEPKISIGDVTIHPDFMIVKNYKPVYIEYWGMEDDEEYKEYMKSKSKLYSTSGLTLVNFYSTDYEYLEGALIHKLNEFIEGKVNFEKPFLAE